MKPRILVVNPNATESFTDGIRECLPQHPDIDYDFYTAPLATAPLSIEGVYDSIVTANACLQDLKERLHQWDGFVVACFSAHPLAHALRELTSAPVVSILAAPILMASTLGGNPAIITTSPRWVPLLTHDIHTLGLSALCKHVVSSGMAVLDLERLPREKVIQTLSTIVRDELVGCREADVIILGCAGMAGLEEAIQQDCGDGIVVLDPVRCAVEMCAMALRMGTSTAKRGLYASAMAPASSA